MHVAIVSTFYPNSSDPYRAVFVRNLAVGMVRQGAQVSVIAPVPYAPPWPRRATWKSLRQIERHEQLDGIEVYHPRFAAIPRCEAATGTTYYLGVRACLARLNRSKAIDVLHAHCAYPDGVAVARLASGLGLPFVVTAHGSDINVYAARAGIRPQLRLALSQAAAVVTVSVALRSKVRELLPEGVGRVEQIPCCGFDPALFLVRQKQQCRATTDLSAASRVVTFVGQLLPIKALDDLTSAWMQGLGSGLFQHTDRLVLIGDGPLRPMVEAIAASPAARGTIRVTGPMPQARIADYLSASDLLCLPSLNEGMPNVVVEAFATGRPAVATSVGGLPELVQPGINGVLVPPSQPGRLLEALYGALEKKWDAAQIAATVAGYTWDALASRNLHVLAEVARRGASPDP
jgi:glycosyltransferase involved in cell wall biosynthesis